MAGDSFACVHASRIGVSNAISDKKRANARPSTGPKTPASKARVARNARRHGLNLPVMADPPLALEVEALARDVGPPGGAPRGSL